MPEWLVITTVVVTLYLLGAVTCALVLGWQARMYVTRDREHERELRDEDIRASFSWGHRLGMRDERAMREAQAVESFHPADRRRSEA